MSPKATTKKASKENATPGEATAAKANDCLRLMNYQFAKLEKLAHVRSDDATLGEKGIEAVEAWISKRTEQIVSALRKRLEAPEEVEAEEEFEPVVVV